MKLKEFSNKAKLILIVVFLAGASLLVFNSERSFDIGVTPIPTSSVNPKPTTSSSAIPSLTESPTVSYEPTATPSPVTKGDCRITGCSGQVCSDEEVVTTCEFKEEYTCYKTAKCERQEDGKCGWTPSEELVACLMSAWDKEGSLQQ